MAVGIDRSGAYQVAVEAYLPNADVVYDWFHLVHRFISVCAFDFDMIELAV